MSEIFYENLFYFVIGFGLTFLNFYDASIILFLFVFKFYRPTDFI